MKKDWLGKYYPCRKDFYKIIQIMKLTTLLLLFTIHTFGNGFAQSFKLNLSVKDKPIREVLKLIEDQSGFRFFYNDRLANLNHVTSVEAKEEPMKSVLTALLNDQKLSYTLLDNNMIVILPSEVNQVNNVSGVVSDATTNEPIPGVVIHVDGTATGVVTDENGKYKIEVPSSDAVLLFSYMGYLSEKINVAGQAVIDLKMSPDIKSLNTLVVVGYGVQKKSDLTGSISSIKLENSPLSNLPNINLLDALKGSVPGLNIGSATTAGGNPSFSIRGQNSVKAVRDPLIILDGVVYIGSFNEINPADIASVDILKDASASAIYGSLAANGVIQITTKRGKTDKPTVQLSVVGGAQTYTNRPHMLSASGYIQLRKDRYMADNPTGTYDLNTNLAPYELDAYNANHTVDWFDEVTRIAPFKNYTMSISGLTKHSNYYVSGNYMDQQGIVVGDQFHKFSVLGKIESTITDWLKFGITLSMTSKNADGIAADLTNGTIDSPYSYVYVHDRGSANPGFEDFTNVYERYPQGQTTTASPLWRTQADDKDRNQNYRSTSFARIDVPWIKNLSYTFNYSLNRWEGHSASFQHENMFVNTMLLSELKNPLTHLIDANGSQENSGRTDWYMNHLINYKLTTGDHNIEATLLAERQAWQTYDLKVTAKDFSGAGTSVLGANSLELGNSANYIVNTDYKTLKQLAYMGRLNYSFRHRYFANFSIRRDGYSGYAEGHKFGLFRAGAIAWTASEEDFIKNNLKFLDNLKFRLSYGENGNPSVGAFATFPSISTGTVLLGGTTNKTIAAGNLANKNLDWEMTTALNFGIDFSIFKDVVGGSVDVYNSKTTKLLLNRVIPIFNGFSNVLDNIGEVNNKGIEIQLNSRNINTRNFTWGTGFTFTLNRNKVVKLYGLDANKDGIEDDDVASNLLVGKSLEANYSYVMDGIIQKTDAAYMSIYGGQAGDIKFKDLNGDGKIDPTNDRTIVGYAKPNYTMTLSNTVTYKNFELYFLFNYIAGGGKNNYYVGNNLYAYFPNANAGGTSAN
jgi:TonB-dependent starch-binding outer membrane protein SusC